MKDKNLLHKSPGVQMNVIMSRADNKRGVFNLISKCYGERIDYYKEFYPKNYNEKMHEYLYGIMLNIASDVKMQMIVGKTPDTEHFVFFSKGLRYQAEQELEDAIQEAL